MTQVWKLEVTSFVGTLAFGAVHTYGVLRAPDSMVRHNDEDFVISGGRYRVERVLDQTAADQLNANDERWGRDIGGNWEAGGATNQFDTEEDVVTYAIAAWRYLCDDPGAVLLSGPSYAAGVMKPLAGPEEIIAVLREIWELDESETSTQWTEVREEAEQKWDKAVKEFDLDPHLKGKSGFGPGYPKSPEERSIIVTKTEDGFEVELERAWGDPDDA